MNMDRHFVVTADGSHSLFVPALNEHYHSRHGAVQESLHVFMQMGWEALPPDLEPLHILEIGFGTGLNAFLACLRAEAQGRQVIYSSVEAYPLSETEYQQLNYAELLLQPQAAATLQQMHSSPWETPMKVNSHFLLTKLQARIEDFLPTAPVHLIFFDAFAPEKQPELWSREVFDRMFAQLLPGGLLVTYCVKGDVKRALKAAGFRLKKVPGPPGKREMLQAWKPMEVPENAPI